VTNSIVTDFIRVLTFLWRQIVTLPQEPHAKLYLLFTIAIFVFFLDRAGNFYDFSGASFPLHFYKTSDIFL